MKALRLEKKGFTLVELLVVIAIIGVLASLLFPALSSARAKAKRTKDANNLKQMGSLMLTYKEEFRRHPYQLTDATGKLINPGPDPKTWDATKVAKGCEFIGNLYVEGSKSYGDKNLFLSPLALQSVNVRYNTATGRSPVGTTIPVGYAGWDEARAAAKGQRFTNQTSQRGLAASFDSGLGDAEGINILFADGHIDFLSFKMPVWNSPYKVVTDYGIPGDFITLTGSNPIDGGISAIATKTLAAITLVEEADDSPIFKDPIIKPGPGPIKPIAGDDTFQTTFLSDQAYGN